MTAPRQVEVAPDRLPGWLDRFQASHGGIHWSCDEASGYLVTAADGAWARLTAWKAAQETPPDISRWAQAPSCLGLLLLRRGGYAVGVTQAGELTKHKCGTRYVQSRTAAGGWSQQRFARRRANQADQLVETSATKSAELYTDEGLDGIVIGGDKALVARALKHTALAAWADRPRREFYDIADPRFEVLQSVARRAAAVRVTVSNVSTGH